MILSAAQQERLYPLFVTALATGMRLSELTRPALDRRGPARRPRPWAQPAVEDRRAGRAETRASRRTIPLPAKVTALLREHRKTQLQTLPASEPRSIDLVFRSTVGTPLSQRNVLRVWNRIVERAGVKHRGFHHLRHTYGTSLAERGVHERVARELMGHADSRTTREIYTHTTSRMVDAAAEAVTDALDEVLDSVSGPQLGP